MRKVLKWIVILLGGLIGLIVLVVVASYIITGERINKTYDITPEPVAVPEQVDADLQAWPLLLIDFCRDCHGPSMAGQVLDDDPLFGTLVAENITSGKGGIGGEFNDADWIRALRHGVDPDGKSLMIMPSQSIGQMSDEDLATVIAYVKNLPPVDNELTESRLGPLGRIFVTLGLVPDFLPAEIIDHEAVREFPEQAVSAEYGEYLAFICVVCHAEDMSGGSQAGEGMNLTPGGALANWSEEDFFETMRNGVAPDGKELDNVEMPWRTFRHYSDDELRAIWLYLQSLPAVETEYR